MKLIKEELIKIPNIGGIYLFTNTINNKCYIGQSVFLRKRLLTHLGNFKNKRYNNPLYNALEKYGIDAFEITILETIEENLEKQELRKRLDILEIKYISEYDSYNKGYNQTKGGDGGILGYKMTESQKSIISKNSLKQSADGRYTVFCKNLETGEIIQSVNMVELSKKLNFNIVAARNAKSKHRIYKNKYYFASSLEEIEKVNFNKKEYYTKYNPTDTSNKYLIDYYNFLITVENPTIEKLAKLLNVTKDTINKRHKKLKELGYTLPIDRKRIKGVIIENIKTKEIKNLSIKEGAKFFNIKESSLIKQSRRDSLYRGLFILQLEYEV